MEFDTFMGEKINFWMELKNKADLLDVCDFIREICVLRGKISFYESRIKE